MAIQVILLVLNESSPDTKKYWTTWSRWLTQQKFLPLPFGSTAYYIDAEILTLESPIYMFTKNWKPFYKLSIRPNTYSRKKHEAVTWLNQPCSIWNTQLRYKYNLRNKIDPDYANTLVTLNFSLLSSINWKKILVRWHLNLKQFLQCVTT